MIKNYAFGKDVTTAGINYMKEIPPKNSHALKLREPILIGALFAIFSIMPTVVIPQTTDELIDIPEKLSAPEKKDLSSRRASLMEREATLSENINTQRAKCGQVPKEDSLLKAECVSDLASIDADVKRYLDAVAEFNNLVNQRVARSKEKLETCNAVARQFGRDRAEIERHMHTTESSQDELNEWSKRNQDAQKQAISTSLTYVAGAVASDIETVGGSVSKLTRHAEFLASKARNSSKYQTRMKYVAQLDSSLGRLTPMKQELLGKAIINTGLEADKAWRIARDAMHHEFRIARKKNEALREVLNEPEYRDVFMGGDIDMPGLEVLSALTEQAIEDMAKMELGVAGYEKFTGPTIRSAVFVRDATYSALLSFLSTQRVLQQNDLAGELARASGVLQKQYKKSVDALHACRKS